jgi:hypothetical protein
MPVSSGGGCDAFAPKSAIAIGASAWIATAPQCARIARFAQICANFLAIARPAWFDRASAATMRAPLFQRFG